MSQLPPHPIQPLITDEHGVVRYKSNTIVEFLLKEGGITMNDLAVMDFPREDREHFAQLIGYSHSGAADLSYFSDDVWECSRQLGENSEEASPEVALRQKLDQLREALRGPISELYGIHPEDLGG